jgi:16S rRNA (guanine527-N7)-methyltransferase
LSFHVKPGPRSPEDLVSDAAEALSLALRPAQVQSLLEFESLLRRRAIPLGLVSDRDEDRLLTRHVLDSLRGAALVRPDDQVVVDVGSGAGLPGVVVAIARPDLRLHLVEPKHRRAAFLELARDHLALANVSVHVSRAEEVEVLADLAMARGLAPLGRSWSLARRLLRPGGRLLYFAAGSTTLGDPPPGASDMEVVPELLIDSPGPVVIITRE